MNLHLSTFGQGIPLVLFHGWGFDSSIWLPLVSDLGASYELIFVDLPGFGLTSDMEWSVFKEELLKRLPQQFAVAGWSLGGLYASRLAIEAPDRIRCLVNITSSPRFISEDLWPGVPREVFLGFHDSLSKDVISTLTQFVALQSNNRVKKYAPANPPSQSALIAALSVLESWDLRTGLQSLMLPTLYMFGRLDPITPEKTMKAMQILYPNFTYYLFNKSAHMPFLSHKDEFIGQLIGFIR